MALVHQAISASDLYCDKELCALKVGSRKCSYSLVPSDFGTEHESFSPGATYNSVTVVRCALGLRYTRKFARGKSPPFLTEFRPVVSFLPKAPRFSSAQFKAHLLRNLLLPTPHLVHAPDRTDESCPPGIQYILCFVL